MAKHLYRGSRPSLIIWDTVLSTISELIKNNMDGCLVVWLVCWFQRRSFVCLMVSILRPTAWSVAAGFLQGVIQPVVFSPVLPVQVVVNMNRVRLGSKVPSPADSRVPPDLADKAFNTGSTTGGNQTPAVTKHSVFEGVEVDGVADEMV